MQPVRQLAEVAAGARRHARARRRAGPSAGRVVGSSSRRARSSAWPSTTRRCWAPSCRSRPIRRRSSSAAWIARARGGDRRRRARAAARARGGGARARPRRGRRRRGWPGARAGGRDRASRVEMDADVADRRGLRRRATRSPGSRRARGCAGSCPAGSAGEPRADQQEVGLVGVLARRAGERELVALTQLHAVGVGARDRHALAGAVLDQLGDEGDLGGQRPAELGHQPAQELPPRTPEVPATRRVRRSRSRGISARWRPCEAAMLDRSGRARKWGSHTAGYGYLPSWTTHSALRPRARPCAR